ncbi:trypsin-like peptidase domain-containing protein [Streptomyces sp. PA03-1a]|nr:trypsin-like peptidase domain-containing protein [Streptomyces sp. PA03-1a]MDX2818228.1 trypsin-like peptidase domain-containing protein [Streptomyces sp. PA03-5A]
MNESTRHDDAYDPRQPQQSPGAGGYPSRPPYEPHVPYGHPAPYASQPQPQPQPQPTPMPAPATGIPRQRRRRPVALVASVALVSALIGGGTAALVGRATTSPAVAGTTTKVIGTSSSGSTGVAAVAAAVSPSIVEISATSGAGQSTGSGVVVTGDGEIVTNNHVVSGADSVKVTFSSGKSVTAAVVGTDGGKDLALVKAEGVSGLPVASLGDSSRVSVGDQVVAIGSPEGLTGTVTSGIVSALDRDVTISTGQGQGQRPGGGTGRWPFEFGGGQYNGDVGPSTTTYKAIQTDASLNPGNSGGALINMNGEIIGINSAMYSAASSSSGQAGSVGLGFAIPVNTLKADLDTLRNGGGDS